MHLPANALYLMSLELAEVSGDAVEVFGIFSALDLCENPISSVFSLGVFCSNLSKASVNFWGGSQVLDLVWSQHFTKLGQKIWVIINANLTQEGTKVV